MTKRKPKKSLRPPRTRNPKMIQDESPPPPTEMIQVVEEEEDEIQELQNPNNESIIEVAEKKETLQQSDEITCTKNPKSIDDEEPHLPETIPEEDPKSIEKEDEATTTTTDSVSVHEELQTQSLKMIVEEEEEEEEEEGDQPSANTESKDEEEEEDDEEEPEGMALSPMMPSNHNHHHQHQHQQTEGMTTLSSPPAHDHDTIMCDLVSESPPPTLTRKSSIRKRKKTSTKYQRKPLNRKQRAVLEKKLQCCKENLQPIPFVPTKTLDFSKHEQLFKRLGLWDFVHIEFDQVIRSDLLAQLIVSYKERSSTVNDLKIKVNRADLGRALKLPLPVKKDKNSLPPETMDLDAEVLSDESISFLDEFVSNWFLLHEDMWMMPDEVLNNTRCIKEGQPEKVDWPGLIWFMVEKELSQGTKLKSCYYASHLQYLMRSQKDVLFKEEPKVEEKSMEQKEENGDVERISLEEIQEEELGKQHIIELALGQEKNNVEQQQVRDDDEDVMDFQECKEEPGDSSQWFLDGKSNFEEHCFRRCNNVVKIDGLDDQCTVKEEEHEEEKYDISSKCSLEGLTSSTDLLHQGIGTTHITYSPSMQLQLLDDNSGELLHTRSNPHMNQGGPSMFGNTCKRPISHVEEEEEEEDIQHDIFGGHNKRMRNNGSWENKASDIDPDYCMEQITSWVAKARVGQAQKDEVYMNAQMNQQYLMSEVQHRNDLIATLQTKCEGIQRREIEMYKLEHELRMMSNLLVGYRTALKQTQREFSEYRERCPEPEEPLYKDVPGGGGLVLSTTELEKQRLEREEEEKMQRRLRLEREEEEKMQRRFFEELTKKFEGSCIATLEVSEERVHLLDKKLLELEEKFKVRKEILSAKHKMPEAHKMPEEEGCIAEEEEEEEEEEKV